MKKNTLLFNLMFALVLVLAQPSFASQSDDVKKIIFEEYKKHVSALEADREHFNLTPNESFKASELGDPYPYYFVNNNFAKKFSTSDNFNSDDMFTFAGYIFPIKIGNKPLGVVVSNNFGGNWHISDISDYNAFENDLNEHEVKLKGDVKLVSDPRFGLNIVVGKNDNNEESGIVIQDNAMSQLKRGENKSLKEISNIVKAAHSATKKDNAGAPALGGIGLGTTANSNHFSEFAYIATISVAVLFILAIIVSRKFKNS